MDPLLPFYFLPFIFTTTHSRKEKERKKERKKEGEKTHHRLFLFFERYRCAIYTQIHLTISCEKMNLSQLTIKKTILSCIDCSWFLSLNPLIHSIHSIHSSDIHSFINLHHQHHHHHHHHSSHSTVPIRCREPSGRQTRELLERQRGREPEWKINT